MLTTDMDLITRAQGGECDAMEELLEKGEGLLRSIMHRMDNLPIDCEKEDVLQIARISFVEAVLCYQPGGATLAQWVCYVVRKKMFSEIRRANFPKQTILSHAEPLDDLFEPLDELDPMLYIVGESAVHDVLRRLVQKLSETERNVLRELLHEGYWRGRYKVIGQHLGMAEKSVDNTQKRICRKARDTGITPEGIG